jgi:hypothetical protein
VTLALLCFGLPATGHAQSSFDLRLDWSNTSNPNGAWRYRQGTSLLTSGTWSSDFSPQPAWLGTSPSVILRTQSTAGFDVLVGDVVLHTANGANPLVNVQWTSPSAGTVDVSGGVWMIRDIGRSNSWALSHNAGQLSTGALSSGDPYNRSSPFSLDAGSGGAINALPVLAGDTLQLTFQQTTGGTGDYVGVNFTITFAAVPEPSTVAFVLLGAGAVYWYRRRHVRKQFQLSEEHVVV